METHFLTTAWRYACKAHSDTNHEYEKNVPYSYHLNMVYEVGKEFTHLIPDKDRQNVLAACWCHDLIEDARETYNDVKKNTNKEVADLVFALTNEKGKTRSERANHRYYEGIRLIPNATFIKLCDRIANIKHGLKTGSSMVNKYRDENPHFIRQLYDPELAEMFVYLKQILEKEVKK